MFSSPCRNVFAVGRLLETGGEVLQIPDMFKSEPEKRRKMNASVEKLFLKAKQCLFALVMELFMSLSR